MARKVKMLVEVECSDHAFDPNDSDSVEWFRQEVLMNTSDDGCLILHSNEVGQELGRVRVLIVHDWPPKKTPNAQLTGPLVGHWSDE